MRKNPLTSETYVLHMFGVFLTLVPLYRSRQNLAHILWMKGNKWLNEASNVIIESGRFLWNFTTRNIMHNGNVFVKNTRQKTERQKLFKRIFRFCLSFRFQCFFWYFCMTETTNESRTNHNIKCVAKWGKFLGFSALYHQHIGHLM